VDGGRGVLCPGTERGDTGGEGGTIAPMSWVRMGMEGISSVVSVRKF